jgi:hypothetical protein
MFYMDVTGFSGAEGWIVNETREDRTGLVGGITYDMGIYYQFKSYAPRMAYRIDALYT